MTAPELWGPSVPFMPLIRWRKSRARIWSLAPRQPVSETIQTLTRNRSEAESNESRQAPLSSLTPELFGSANRRSHRREAQLRAEDSAICVLRATPGAPGESFFLLASTYHGRRQSGQNSFAVDRSTVVRKGVETAAIYRAATLTGTEHPALPKRSELRSETATATTRRSG